MASVCSVEEEDAAYYSKPELSKNGRFAPKSLPQSLDNCLSALAAAATGSWQGRAYTLRTLSLLLLLFLLPPLAWEEVLEVPGVRAANLGMCARMYMCY